jgi:NAD(P)H-flavin reductase
MVAWWTDDEEHKARIITLLVKIEAGFTRNLTRYTNNIFRVGIDGPYGKATDFGQYGSVMMIATGIGVAGQTPHIRALLKGHKARKTVTRRVHLVWQLERECEPPVPLRYSLAYNIQVIKNGWAIGWTSYWTRMS